MFGSRYQGSNLLGLATLQLMPAVSNYPIDFFATHRCYLSISQRRTRCFTFGNSPSIQGPFFAVNVSCWMLLPEVAKKEGKRIKD